MSFRKICERCVPLLTKHKAIDQVFKTRYSSRYVLKCLSSDPPDVFPKEITDIIYAAGDEKTIHCGDKPIYILKGAKYGCCQSYMAQMRNEDQCLADVWIGARVSGSNSLIPDERLGKFTSEKENDLS